MLLKVSAISARMETKNTHITHALSAAVARVWASDLTAD